MISSRSGRIFLTAPALTIVRRGLRPALLPLQLLGLDRVDLPVGPGAELLDHIALPVEPPPEHVDQERVRAAMRRTAYPHDVPPLRLVCADGRGLSAARPAPLPANRSLPLAPGRQRGAEAGMGRTAGAAGARGMPRLDGWGKAEGCRGVPAARLCGPMLRDGTAFRQEVDRKRKQILHLVEEERRFAVSAREAAGRAGDPATLRTCRLASRRCSQVDGAFHQIKKRWVMGFIHVIVVPKAGKAHALPVARTAPPARRGGSGDASR